MPPTTLSGPPRQIPPPVDDFVGRESELDELCQAMETGGAAISGVRGLGGIGKTQLALMLVKRLGERCPDGQIMLDLKGPDPAHALPPEQVLAHVIHSFSPVEKLPEDLSALQGLYCQVLAGKRVLLLLDNAAEEKQIEPLLPPPPGCLALVTSRAHLVLPKMKELNLDTLPEADAVMLMLSIEPRMGAAGAKALAKACGYLPLALRVLASLMRKRVNLSAEDLLRRMQDEQARLNLSGVEASLELSYQMLPEDLKEKWRKLGVFAGDFALPAAAFVWGMVAGAAAKEQDDSSSIAAQDAVQDAMGELIAYSLLDFKADRCRLHDLARAFARKKLSEAERYAVRLAHSKYYLGVLSICSDLYHQGGSYVVEGLARLDRERAEITAGQAWAAMGGKDERERLGLAKDYPNVGAVIIYLRLHPREFILWLEAGLQASRLLGARRGEGYMLTNLGAVCAGLGEPRQAIKYYESALVIARETGDRHGRGGILHNLGTVYADLGELRRAIEYYELSLVSHRMTGDRYGKGMTLNNLGLAYTALGEPRRAIEYFEQAQVIEQETGDRRMQGSTLNNLGVAYADLKEPRRAIEYYEQAQVIAREIGDLRGEGNTLGNLGDAYWVLEETQQAIAHYEQARLLFQETGDRRGEAICSWNLGLAYEKQGELSRAVELMQLRVDYEREIGHPDAESHAARVAAIRARIAGDGQA